MKIEISIFRSGYEIDIYDGNSHIGTIDEKHIGVGEIDVDNPVEPAVFIDTINKIVSTARHVKQLDDEARLRDHYDDFRVIKEEA